MASVTLSSSSDSPTTASISNVHHIAGSHGKIAALDPKWLTPTIGIFTSDEGGWANPWIFTLDPDDDHSAPHVERAVNEIIYEEFGGPQWWLSWTYSASLRDGKALFVSYRNGRSVLNLFDFSLPLEERKRIEIATPFVQISYMHGDGRRAVCLGKGSSEGDKLVSINLAQSTGTKTVIIFLLPPETPHPVLCSENVSVPEYHQLTLPAVPEAGLPERQCHVNYYPPHNPMYSGGKEGEKPPVIVRIHGGPFMMETCALDWTRQFWTSRGWAQ